MAGEKGVGNMVKLSTSKKRKKKKRIHAKFFKSNPEHACGSGVASVAFSVLWGSISKMHVHAHKTAHGGVGQKTFKVFIFAF